MQFTPEQIGKYYDVTRDHYRYFWQLNQCRALHYGYWDDSTTNFVDAMSQINRELANLSGIEKGMHILDAGCGEGGSMIWLANHYHVNVTGITLSRRQVESIREYLLKQGLSRVSVELMDYHKTHFGDATFDVIWAIESPCQSADKPAFLREMYRILKPGGYLVVADFLMCENPSKNQLYYMQRWAYSWTLESYATRSEFLKGASDAGFRLIEDRDITQNVRPSAVRLYRAAILGFPLAAVYNLFFSGTSEEGRRNVLSGYWQYKALALDAWSYRIFKFLK